MTLLVGIHCTDGVVIAADSASTFGSAPGVFTITHPVRKIQIIADDMIVAGTGEVGLGQRFHAAIAALHASSEYKGSAIEKAKLMAAKGIADFAATSAPRGAFVRWSATCTNSSRSFANCK